MECGGRACRHRVGGRIQVALRRGEALVKQRGNSGHGRSSGRCARENREGSSSAAIHAASAAGGETSEIAVVIRGGKRDVGCVAAGSRNGHACSGLPTWSQDVTADA